MNVSASLRKAMYPVFSLHYIDTSTLVEEHNFVYAEQLAASVYFGLADWPYNIWLVREDKNSNHLSFVSADVQIV